MGRVRACGDPGACQDHHFILYTLLKLLGHSHKPHPGECGQRGFKVDVAHDDAPVGVPRHAYRSREHPGRNVLVLRHADICEGESAAQLRAERVNNRRTTVSLSMTSTCNCGNGVNQMGGSSDQGTCCREPPRKTRVQACAEAGTTPPIEILAGFERHWREHPAQMTIHVESDPNFTAPSVSGSSATLLLGTGARLVPSQRLAVEEAGVLNAQWTGRPPPRAAHTCPHPNASCEGPPFFLTAKMSEFTFSCNFN